MASPFGVLNINKPADWTSRDVVNRVQGLVRPAKAGHAGTLDPLATGVLVVCVGKATRLIEYVQQQPKPYEAGFLLGRRSDTDDVEGSVEELPSPPVPTREQIDSHLPRFMGTIDQRPPAYSAVKIGGKRAYKLARAGERVEMPSRKVHVDELVVREYDYPLLRLGIVCGSGTYIRSLGRDLAEALGTAAVMSELCRMAVGDFRLDDAVPVEELGADNLEEHLMPASTAVTRLPGVALDDAAVEAIGHGRLIDVPASATTREVAAFDSTGRLVAILARDARGRWKPHRNFA
jgi:tRNA pseudouridine55 synthase